MMSQMNVRIDDELRVEGNLALESVGWSPSRAARELWGYAARNRRNPRKLREMVELLDESAAEKAKGEAQPSEVALRGPQIFEEFRERLGLSRSGQREIPSYDELREEAFLERRRERGLL